MSVKANRITKALEIALLLFMFAPATLSAQGPTDLNEVERRQQLINQMRTMERELGRQNTAMIEILLSLADSSSDLGLYSESSDFLERAIQIRRLNQGLTTASQIPLYFTKIETDMRREDWDSVNRALDYLFWLTVEKAAVTDASLVEYLLQMSDFHLQAVAADQPAQRARHYREASELIYVALEISERLWGSNDFRRLDMFYNLIKHFHLQSAALEFNDETAYGLRAVVPGSNWVKPKRVVQSNYYRAGLRLFDSMEEIVQTADHAAESLAMLNLYRADWHLLFNQNVAREAYSNSFSELVAAGQDRARINELFSEPRVLPVPQFHATLSAAEAGSMDAAIRVTAPAAVKGDAADAPPIAFREWFRDMPAVSYPRLTTELSFDPMSPGIWLHFVLGPLNSVSRWINGSYRSRLSVMEEFDILSNEVEADVDLHQLDDRLHFLHLRPRLVDGKPRAFEGTLLYQVAAQ